MPQKTILHYHVIIKKPEKCRFKVVYKNGMFHKMQKISGKIQNPESWLKLTTNIPYKESVMQQKMLSLPPHLKIWVEYKEDKQTAFKLFLDVYLHWHEENCGFTPNIHSGENKALQKIISYLCSLTKSMDEALDVWKLIFQNWEQLDQFHQKLTKLTQIFSYISPILIQIKENAQSYR